MLFAFEQHLRQEGPQRDGRRVNRVAVLGKRCLLFREHGLNLFGRQGIGERQTGLLQERVENQAKTLWQQTAKSGK